MTTALFLSLMMMSSPYSGPYGALFLVQSNIQALYDEVDQATLQFSTSSDIDLYHAVRFAPGWTFVDAQGTRHSWDDMRAAAIASLDNREDWLADSVQKVVSVKSDTAIVLVNETVVRKATAETTPYRDTWVRSEDSWKFETREQVGPVKTAPYTPYND